MGKTNSRALNCHNTLTEAVFRLGFNKFIEERTWIFEQFQAISQGYFLHVDKDSWKMFVGEPDVEDFVQHFNDFIQSTELGNTAEFWIQYINHVSLCLTLIKSLKTSNFYVYQYCLIQIYDLFSHAVTKIKQNALLSFQFTH